MLNHFRSQHKVFFDFLYFTGFLLVIIVGALAINTFLFRSFNVIGPSMEPTLMPDDRLIVNKIPRTLALLSGQSYLPDRGQIVVFKNPLFNGGRPDEFIVKRIIGLPGERVIIKKGTITVFNQDNPRGFKPDKLAPGPKSPTIGDVDITIPPGELFVSGDNRVGNNSLDSRNGLGTIPLYELEGSVAVRLYPLDQIRTF